LARSPAIRLVRSQYLPWIRARPWRPYLRDTPTVPAR
jgi:hypothetical protein